ncbi:MAG TPA: hypothetical protein VM577_18390 [Anaerovoracaceae bacterium]|nr:hypothetical protein [Anaerovoracaceae bacterium]
MDIEDLDRFAEEIESGGTSWQDVLADRINHMVPSDSAQMAVLLYERLTPTGQQILKEWLSW